MHRGPGFLVAGIEKMEGIKRLIRKEFFELHWYGDTGAADKDLGMISNIQKSLSNNVGFMRRYITYYQTIGLYEIVLSHKVCKGRHNRYNSLTSWAVQILSDLMRWYITYIVSPLCYQPPLTRAGLILKQNYLKERGELWSKMKQIVFRDIKYSLQPVKNRLATNTRLWRRRRQQQQQWWRWQYYCQ